MLDRLATFLHRRARRVLLVAVFAVAFAGVFGGPAASLLGDENDDFDDPAAEAVVTADRLEAATGASATPDLVALVRFRRGEDRAAKLAAVARTLRADERVAVVRGPRSFKDDPLVARDGRSAYLTASFAAGADVPDTATDLDEALQRQAGVVVGGRALAQEQIGTQVSEDLRRAEMLAFPLLFVLSLIVFRGLIAALLPLAVGMTTVLSTFAAMRLVDASVTGLSIFALNLVIGLGLGLSIDYSLFMVSRFREELAQRAGDTAAALRATMATAGRTVLFSAVTVAAALASLIVFPQRFLFSMGIGGLLVGLIAATVSLTLLPALLAALGPRVNALSPARLRRGLERDAAGERGGGWYRLSQLVMRRAAPVAAGAVALLIALGIPFTHIHFTGVDASLLPREHSARVVDDALKHDFAAHRTTPVTVAADTRDGAAVRRWAAQLRRLDGVEAVQVARAGDLYRVDIVTAAAPRDGRAEDVVGTVRAGDPPFAISVGGQSADFLDRQASLGAHLPVALLVLAALTLVILFLMTGSVVLPLKALVMNLLTVSAAFGLLVLIFQDGRFEGLLGYTSEGALDSTQPILLFATAFGLSTDYGVFLLTRIKEARDRGAGEAESVALGLERTGRIVTAAALLFVVAIGAFATSEIVFIKELGVGTALAVAIDATIVRALLVPALMRLLGRWNWWAPRPLARLHARIGLREGGPAGHPVAP